MDSRVERTVATDEEARGGVDVDPARRSELAVAVGDLEDAQASGIRQRSHEWIGAGAGVVHVHPRIDQDARGDLGIRDLPRRHAEAVVGEGERGARPEKAHDPGGVQGQQLAVSERGRPGTEHPADREEAAEGSAPGRCVEAAERSGQTHRLPGGPDRPQGSLQRGVGAAFGFAQIVGEELRDPGVELLTIREGSAGRVECGAQIEQIRGVGDERCDSRGQGLGVTGIRRDRRPQLVPRAGQRPGTGPVQRLVVRLERVLADRRPQEPLDVDRPRQAGIEHGAQVPMWCARRQAPVQRLGAVRHAPGRGRPQDRFGARRLVPKTTRRAGIHDEPSAATEGEQRDGVEESHPEAPDDDVFARGHA